MESPGSECDSCLNDESRPGPKREDLAEWDLERLIETQAEGAVPGSKVHSNRELAYPLGHADSDAEEARQTYRIRAFNEGRKKEDIPVYPVTVYRVSRHDPDEGSS